MSKLGNFRRLPVTVSSGNLYHASEDISSDCVLFTQIPKFVSVLNVSGNNIVKEWVLQQKHNITCPVISDKKSKKYVAVTDEMVLKTWDKNDSKIGKAQQCTLLKEVHQLVCVGDTTAIIYKDGSLSTYQQQIQYLGKTFVEDDEQISHCEGHVLKDAAYVVLVVQRTVQSVSSVKTCVYKLNNKEELMKCYESRISVPGGSNCVASCLQCRKNHLFLTVLWSSGHLCQLDVTNCSLVQENLTQLTSSLTSSLVSMVTLSDTQVAILGVTNETGTAGLGIWDTSFGIMQAWTALPDKNVSKAKLHRHKNRLLLLSDKGLYSCPFVAMTTTISSVLGSLKHQTGQSMQTETPDTCDLVQLGEELLTQTGIQFKNIFEKFLHRVEKSKENKLLASSFVSRLIHQWINKSTSDRKYCPPDKQLSQLLDQRLLTASDFDRLLPVLTEHNNVCFIYRCLKHVPHISESVMCKCLVFYLSCEDNRLEEAAEELGRLTQKPAELESLSITDAQCVFLSQILCMPFNDVFLLEKLKYISFTHVMVLMNYLHYRLIETTKPPQIPPCGDSYKEPTLLQVIDWLNLLIDAHCTQLVLSQETKAFVIELHQLVETKVEFFKELDALEAVLFQLKEKHTVPQRKTVGPYCIETLHIV